MPQGAFEPLSEKEIKQSLWYLAHRAQLRRAAVALLVILDVFLLLPALVFVGLDIGKYRARATMNQELVSPSLIRARDAAAPLEIGATVAIVQDKTMDVVIAAENPNEEFTAKVTYTFRTPAGILGPYTDVIAPGARTHLVALGLPRLAMDSVTLEPLLVRWRRTNAHQEGTYAGFLEKSGTIRISDIERSAATDRGAVGVRFRVMNQTAFHLQQLPVVIVLRRGSSIAAVNRVVLERVRSGESRMVDVQWKEAVGAIQSIAVEPHVDLLDWSNRFIPPPGSL